MGRRSRRNIALEPQAGQRKVGGERWLTSRCSLGSFALLILGSLCLAVPAVAGAASSASPAPRAPGATALDARPAGLVAEPGVEELLPAEDPSALRAASERMGRSVAAWALRNNAVFLPRWIGPEPDRKYKQSTVFEMHSEMGDRAELALRVQLKRKRFFQIELRF